MRLLSVFLGILLTVVNNKCSCTKEPPPEPLRGPLHFTQEFKDYNLFQNGSQWIYQKQNTQDKDTILQEITISEMRDENYCGCNFESYLARQKSSFFNNIIIFRGYVAKYLPSQDFDYATMSHEGVVSETSSTATFFTGSEVGKEREIYLNEFITYTIFYPTYTLEGKTYQDVKVFESSFGLSNSPLPRKTYYAKNVGIIRRELRNGQVWNLISYEVKQ